MRWALAVLALWLALPLHAAELPPEPATGFARRQPVAAERQMVVAAHPLAAQAGREMLRRGGSAVDAAIAAQLVLGLVEPQSSGIGGGGFLVLRLADGMVTTFDGRETAPAAARPHRFLRDGKPMPFLEAVVDGRSVGVPGLMRMLELAHGRHGRLDWASLFEPALRLAEDGFPVSARLHRVLALDRFLRDDESARALYYPDGAPVPEGAILRNRAYADTLRLLARQGAAALYQGALAESIVAAVGRRGGDLTLADLATYRAVERPPVCGLYRLHRICSMGPPSSGGLAVLRILAEMEPLMVARMPPLSPAFADAFARAGRVAFAERERVGDPAYAAVPEKAAPGEPATDSPNTTHVSAVDGDGQAVAMTTSIEHLFGAHIMAGGFLLNNQLTDFTFRPGGPNQVEGGKRPRSSMAPTLVDAPGGGLKAVAGSPGGSWIINYVARAVIGLVDWDLDPQAAADLPHLGSRGGPVELEDGTPAEALKAPLEAMGHEVRVAEMTSGLHLILLRGGRLWGGADGRREGAVAGD